MGDVTIGAESSIWFNAVLRGDTEAIRVGQQTNVQDLCVLHTDLGLPCILGDRVSLGHGAIVHGAIVEVDPELCQVKVRKYVCIHDCGNMINPMIVEGQVMGGVQMGLGNAFYEQMVYAEATTVLPLIASYVYHSGAWKGRKRRSFSRLWDEQGKRA